jgi:pantetheine-phosphate adenylyltransferase
VREIAMLSGEVDKFVSPYVAQELQRKVAQRRAEEA